MKIEKTEKSSNNRLGALRAKFPGNTEIQIDDHGKLVAQITVWVPDGKDKTDQHQVLLTDGDIERLLTCLAQAKDPDTRAAVSKLMRENLRNILRLNAMGSGIMLVD